MRTLLFDIDGTLLTANGGGKQAMRLALRQEFDVAEPDVDISFGGRTDRGLAAELLRRNSLDPSEQACQRFRQAYTQLFPAELQRTGGAVFAGVRDLLTKLNGSDGCRVAAMTGNFSETADRKLKHFRLRHHVEWIIGGDLDFERNEMAGRAQQFIRDRHGPGAADDLVVIGDTVADIRCGRSIGASVVAVCTGGVSRQELRAAGPDAIWDDFSDWEAVAEGLIR